MPTDGATDIFPITDQWLHNLIRKESPRPALTPVHGMEYAMGLNAAEKDLAAPRFEHGSPAWESIALSITPQAHAPLAWISVENEDHFRRKKNLKQD